MGLVRGERRGSLFIDTVAYKTRYLSLRARNGDRVNDYSTFQVYDIMKHVLRVRWMSDEAL